MMLPNIGSLSSRMVSFPSLLEAIYSPPSAPCMANRQLTSTPAPRSASIRSRAPLGSPAGELWPATTG
ncbi:hypothetical protein LI173_02975 [Phocaeicola vulgatus]|nr:hypothetical protein [Phocaeicola vulgatus]MCB6639518.1 hypothetical protein [Phocaeicola vulgatus]